MMLKSYKLLQQMVKISYLFMLSLVNVISPEASAVNKLTFQRGMLFYDGKPITDAVAIIDVALKNFIEWLK